MEKSKIKNWNVYYVNYDPVRKGEFGGGPHLAVVLKESDDGHTFWTVPLTSKGGRRHLVDLGFLKCLPWRLRRVKSYAVVTQARAISPSRIREVYDKGKPVDIVLPEGRLKKLKCAIREELCF